MVIKIVPLLDLLNPDDMEWISVKEGLPENKQEVLCWNGSRVVMAVFERARDLDGGQAFMVQKYPSVGDRSLVTSWTNITHWMELPNPPQQ